MFIVLWLQAETDIKITVIALCVKLMQKMMSYGFLKYMFFVIQVLQHSFKY